MKKTNKIKQATATAITTGYRPLKPSTAKCLSTIPE